MNNLICVTAVTACLVGCAPLPVQTASAKMNVGPATTGAMKAIDFSDAEQSTDAFIRMRGDSSGKDVVTHWLGSGFAVLPGTAPERIFGFEGFNVARMERQSDGSWRMLSREYAVYRDPESNAILATWANPYTRTMNTVFQVQNDPVNQSFGRKNAKGELYLMPFDVLGNQVQLGFDIPIRYPNPIQPDKFPAESTGTLYTGSEHFGFFAQKSDFEVEAVNGTAKMRSVPMQISWARTSPWLPWMKMGNKPGYMLFSAWGKKLNNINELTPDLLAHVTALQPKFLRAPREFVQPNATTWSEYKRLVLDSPTLEDPAQH
jgi:hypothetical protein